MSALKLLKEAEKVEIVPYKKRPEDVEQLKKNSVSYTGSLVRHPYEKDRVVLISDPSSVNTEYFEFRTEDVSLMEKLPNITNLEGETITMARVWIKRHSVALKSIPFIVDEPDRMN